MPRAQVEKELGRLEELIRRSSSGLGRKQISEGNAAGYKTTLANRTLQRRLEELVIQDKVVVIGEGPGTTYRARSEASEEVRSEEGYVPLSASGKKLRDLIRRPITDRPPVGYERDWLFPYAQTGKDVVRPEDNSIRAFMPLGKRLTMIGRQGRLHAIS